MNTLIQNAALSLKMGIEDYRADDAERAMSSVRNVTAAVLLFFKEKLRLLSPPDSDEVLLKERIQPSIEVNGAISFKGSTKRTVDVQQIKERFKSLNITVEWKRVDNVVQIRNSVEHYYSDKSDGRMRELVADTFLLIRDFLTTHLLVDPVDILDGKTWSAILETAEVYAKELEQCRKETAKAAWPNEEMRKISEHLRCATCDSELIKPQDAGEACVADLVFKCASCGGLNEFEDIVEAGVDEYLGADAHIRFEDWEEAPYVMCPDCCRRTYLVDADFCAACSYKREYTECAICSAALSVDEQEFAGLCGYHNYVAEKERDR